MPYLKSSTRGSIRLSFFFGVPVVILLFVTTVTFMMTISMPGRSFRGFPPPLSDVEESLILRLKSHLHYLADTLGPKNLVHYNELQAANRYIQNQFVGIGLPVQTQTITVAEFNVQNIEAQITGTKLPNDIIVIGAHYDTDGRSPGANDNGSGVSALLELARYLEPLQLERTVRFVAFPNEEMPHYQSPYMGSWNYAKACREKNENIVAMISIETIGYFTEVPKSQKYPFPLQLLYPSHGNFLAFVGNPSSAKLVRTAIKAFRKSTPLPSEGAILPSAIPGVSWSDHWAFWQENYPAIMITDTAPFRYPYYHSPEDTSDKITWNYYARAVVGIKEVVLELSKANKS